MYVPNAKAVHEGGKSTSENYKITFIRTSNFKYGEFLYEYKVKKLRTIKIIRQFFQNIFFLILNIFTLNFRNILKSLAIFVGIIKFLKFIFKKKFFYLLNF